MIAHTHTHTHIERKMLNERTHAENLYFDRNIASPKRNPEKPIDVYQAREAESRENRRQVESIGAKLP